MKKKHVIKNEENYDFNLEGFTGPLDLLLHLAKTNEIEISTISLDTLIDQYIHYIEIIHHKGIDITSSYLEMAAELIRLKSVTLLPHNFDKEEILDEIEELGFDREQIINKLLEYKKYKEITSNFIDLSESRLLYLTKKPDQMSTYRDDNFKNSLDINLFQKVTASYLQQQIRERKKQKVIQTHELSTEDYIEELKSLTIEFSFKNKIKNLPIEAMISIFLAILESLKLQYISFYLIKDDLMICPYQGDNDE